MHEDQIRLWLEENSLKAAGKAEEVGRPNPSFDPLIRARSIAQSGPGVAGAKGGSA
jgi:hypothetical protein